MDLINLVRFKKPINLGQVPGYLPPSTETNQSFEASSISYNAESCAQASFTELEDLTKACQNLDSNTVNWININDSCPASVKALTEAVKIHPLVQEDIVNLQQRPKVEDWDDYLYVVVKMLYFSHDEHLQQEQLSFLLGKNYLISFQEKPGDVFDTVRSRITNSKGRIRNKGTDYLLYSLLDAICDQYYIVLDKLGAKAELIEHKVEKDPSAKNFTAIQELKQELIHVRRSILPVQELCSALIKTESSLIHRDTIPFWKDLLDHSHQVIESAETLRDFVNGVIEISHALLSNRMNEVMKVLTMVSTIFIPTTFIAGIYGMNFENMPELSYPGAYQIALCVMLLISIAMLIFFKIKRWW